MDICGRYPCRLAGRHVDDAANGWYAGERRLSRFIGGAVILADYNRKNLRTFALCMGAMVAAVVLFNLLFLAGLVKP